MEKQEDLEKHVPNLKERIYFFALGPLLAIPLSIFYQNFLDTYLTKFFSETLVFSVIVVIVAPLIEELLKAVPLLYRHIEVKKSIMNLAIYLGVGFGLSELILYVVNYNVPLRSRIPSLIFHPVSAIIIAYGINKGQTLKFFLVSLFFHSGSNYIKLVQPAWTLGWLILNIIAVILAVRLYNER